MPGKKISLIGASNLYTNSTCVFGSMAGLAPTATVRPHVTSLPGYKYLLVGNDKKYFPDGCGLGKHGQKGCDDGRKCLKKLNLHTVYHRHDPVRRKVLG